MTSDSKALLEIAQHINLESTLLFLGDTFKPELSSAFLDLPWSGVFTTLRQSEVSGCLSKSNRRVSEIITTKDSENIHFNRKELSLVRLKGVDDIELDEFDQEKVTQVFLEKIPYLLKTHGRLIFDGFNPVTDQILMRDIYLQLSKINRKKFIYFFGLEDTTDAYLAKLIQNGSAITIPHHTWDIIYELIDDDDFSFLWNQEESSNQLSLYNNQKVIRMDSHLEQELLQNIEPFAKLLDYNAVEQSEIFPAEKMYQYFQSFLRSSMVGQPKWYGYRETSGFHINRYFENELYNVTVDALEDSSKKERKKKPIMLCGQACCGKTNAMGALAYRIFNERKYPVLYIHDPDVEFTLGFEKSELGIVEQQKADAFSSLEHLIHALEQKVTDPSPTLIIWDTACRTSAEVGKAYDLLRMLRSRGRRVQVVCTGYARSKNETNSVYNKYNCIDVEIALRKNDICDEPKLITNLLVTKAGMLAEDADRLMRYYSASDNFICSLYLFRELHINLKNRVRRENEGQIEDMARLIEQHERDAAQEKINTVMAMAIKKAMEKSNRYFEISHDEQEFKNEQAQKSQSMFTDLVCCIAMCTLFRERMPMSMALRITSSYSTESIPVFNAIMSNSLLCCDDIAGGETVVYLRSEVEAKLLLEEYEKSEVDLLLIMIENMAISNDYNASAEQRLIQNIIMLGGPNSKMPTLSLWTQHYTEFEFIIHALRDFRAKDPDTSLILQEITLTREFCCDRERWPYDDEKRIKLLNDLLKTTENEIDRRDKEGFERNRLLANLYVEWANVHLRLFEKDPRYKKEKLFTEVSRRMQIVIQHYPRNGYALTAYLWAGLNHSKLISNEDERLHLLQDLDHMRNTFVDDDDSWKDNNLLGELDNALDSIELTDGRFQASIKAGKGYGLYFRARKLLFSDKERVDFNKPLIRKAHREICRNILELLENKEYKDIVYADTSCLYILINVKWLSLNGTPIIPDDEDQVTKISDDDWHAFYKMCDEYLNARLASRPPRILYLMALCAAQIPAQRSECDALFDELQKGTSFEKRGLHVLCKDDGTPLAFSGRIVGSYKIQANRGYVNLKKDGFRREVMFRAHRIGRVEKSLRDNDLLTNLNIVLSFSGFQAIRLLGDR